MPDRITMWKCNVCQAKYYTKERAARCEEEHPQRVEIISGVFKKGEKFPVELVVRMNGQVGKEVTYRIVESSVPDAVIIRKDEWYPGDDVYSNVPAGDCGTDKKQSDE